LRPPSDRRRRRSAVGSLAAVPEPCRELPVRVRVRRATVMGPSDGNLVGIIGAGRLGQAMARTARRAGREVVIANSRGPESLASVVSNLGEGVSAGTVDEAASAAIVVIAVPWDRLPRGVQRLHWKGQGFIYATTHWG